jgi:hypothetical protein
MERSQNLPQGFTAPVYACAYSAKGALLVTASLLIKRQLLDQIGPLEAKAGLNIFDTDALCLKILEGRLLPCLLQRPVHPQFRQPRLALACPNPAPSPATSRWHEGAWT